MHDHQLIRSALVSVVRVTDLLRQSRILLIAAAVGTVFWATLLLRPAVFAPIATWSENRFAAITADSSRASDSLMVAARQHTEVNVDLRAPEPAKHLGMRKLTAEQESIAQFLSQRYRVAIDRSQEFVDLAYKTAKETKMDPWLLLAVMSVESSLNPEAMSNRGAQGLMQVLTRVHADKFAPFGGVSTAFDPLVNIRVGARILREYIERDGSIEGALKSYVGAAFHADDRGYGGKVLTERERLAAVATGRPFNEFRGSKEGRSIDTAATAAAQINAVSAELKWTPPLVMPAATEAAIRDGSIEPAAGSPASGRSAEHYPPAPAGEAAERSAGSAGSD